VCVPQIFSQANTPLKRWLLNFAAKRKGAEVSRGIIRMDSLWDKIFFSKIQVSTSPPPLVLSFL
jgi:long-chain acyl-CoA synthetase